MKGQELKPLEDWVLNQKDYTQWSDKEFYQFVSKSLKCAKLLKSTPKLGDFIPCDLDGKPLDDPESTMKQGDGHVYYSASDEEFKAYQEAEQRVLWKGEWDIASSELGTFLGLREKNKKTQNITFDNPNQTYSDLTNKGLIFKRDL